MGMEKVESSNIMSIGYDGELEELTIEFKRGNQFRYKGVKGSIASDFGKAYSKGEYFADFIKGRYEFTQLK